MKLPRFLGTVAKGLVSVIGATLGVGGVGVALAKGDDQLAACVSMILAQPEGLVATVGVVLVLFGVGRKAGYLGATGKTGPT